jgi:predicted MPP superfamily phosphohydrolase
MSRRQALLMAGSVAWALILHMMLLASSAPVERHLHVHGVAPMRVVLVSDLHVATPGDSPARLRRTIGRIEALHPDLILIAGDFLANHQPLAFRPSFHGMIAPLAGFHAPDGVIGISGNHDVPTDLVRHAIAQRGVTMLDNDAVRRGPLAILGVGDPVNDRDREGAAEAEWKRVGGLAVGLAHSPDAVPRFDPAVRLVLAGHTHCGQIALPGIGAIVTNLNRVDRRYACGIVRDGARTTVVTAGLGTSTLPFRLGVPPDFWVIDFGR